MTCAQTSSKSKVGRVVVSLLRHKKVVAFGAGNPAHIALHYRGRLRGRYVLTVSNVSRGVRYTRHIRI